MYLLHFDRPYSGRMRHYVSFTYDLERGVENRRQDTTGATTKLAFDQGIGFTLARTWPGTPKLKRQIKDRGPANYRPICSRPASTLPVQPDRCQWFCRGRSQSRVSAVCVRIVDASGGSTGQLLGKGL
jgi:hypothetical protein